MPSAGYQPAEERGAALPVAKVERLPVELLGEPNDLGPESVNVPRKCCCPLVKSSRYFNDCLSWAVFRVQSRAPGRSPGRQEPFVDVSQGSEVVHLQALRVVAGAGLLFKQEEEFHQR